MVVTEPQEPKTRPQEPDPAAESAVADEDGELERLREELARAQAEAAALKDQFLRSRAEMENVRRRGENEVAAARKFAIERFAGDMLNVRDSLELALSVELPRTSDPLLGKMLEGVTLTLKQLDAVFERYSLEPITPARGDRLDPERHQAMTTQASNEVPAGHVLTLIQRGYLLNGRLLRPAVVIVASEDAPAPGH
jgi:molecular chaperone GrpE